VLWLRSTSQLWPAFLVIENCFPREVPMSRFLIASLVVCSVVVASATDVQAGLFGKMRAGRGCGKASSCSPTPSCCTPASVQSCGCSAPAPVSSCGCGSPAPVMSNGCGGCAGGGVVTSGCTNCSQTMNSGVIVESAAPQAAPPAPATTAPAAPAAAPAAAPTPDAAPSAPAPAAPAA
jgi:hypothetical protein